MKVNFGLMACVLSANEMDVLHFCAFKDRPTQIEYSNLAERLVTEEKYGLVGRTDYVIIEASPKMVKYYENLNPKDEDSYYINELGNVVKM
jgi:DNA-binding HxlR family transcriptional regulator